MAKLKGLQMERCWVNRSAFFQIRFFPLMFPFYTSNLQVVFLLFFADLLDHLRRVCMGVCVCVFRLRIVWLSLYQTTKFLLWQCKLFTR